MWVGATTAHAAPTPADAEAALRAGDVEGAARIWRRWVKAHPDDGAAWFALAGAEHQLARWDAAAAGWERAVALGVRPGASGYNLGCALARAGRADDALRALDAAAGFATGDQLRADPDLASLQADPRFAGVIDRAEAARYPCDHDPRYRAFDFWVGDWVVERGGQRLGTNTITREQHGCVLLERWTDTFGGAGTSFTFLDPTADRWRQLWIDGSGRIAEYAGGFESADRLVMEARTASPGAADGRSRGTWTRNPDGTVRQVFEAQSADGTWVVTFDGTYRPAATP